jgi:flavodoxin
MKIFYFTGTGNSLAVAKRIGGEEQSYSEAACCYPFDNLTIVLSIS